MSELEYHTAFVASACEQVERVAPHVVVEAKRYAGADIDSMGRMNEALIDAEAAVEANDIDAFRQSIDVLTALALSQAGRCRVPGADLL